MDERDAVEVVRRGYDAGANRCLGAQLSRMQAAVGVAETAALLGGATLVRAPRCLDNLSFRLPDSFVITRAGAW